MCSDAFEGYKWAARGLVLPLCCACKCVSDISGIRTSAARFHAARHETVQRASLLCHLCIQECYRPVDDFLEGHSLVFQADRADDPDSINNGVRHLIALQ